MVLWYENVVMKASIIKVVLVLTKLSKLKLSMKVILYVSSCYSKSGYNPLLDNFEDTRFT